MVSARRIRFFAMLLGALWITGASSAQAAPPQHHTQFVNVLRATAVTNNAAGGAAARATRKAVASAINLLHKEQMLLNKVNTASPRQQAKLISQLARLAQQLAALHLSQLTIQQNPRLAALALQTQQLTS